jgi:rare lipoprotein A
MGLNHALRTALLAMSSLCLSAPLIAQQVVIDHTKKHVLDRSGAPEKGKASFYGKEFFGRKMADGTPMDPQSNIAASRTLPIGTKAIVTNLDNGKSAVVEIRDRGPYIEGRIVDLTPKTAEQLDMVERGVVPVEVTPIEVPQRDGSIKLGAAVPQSD